MVKRAILLSAGFGTRLSPITDTIPKCLVPINGKPLLAYWLEQLTAAGINEFLINTHYLAEQVVKFIESSPFRDRITLFNEPELLGTLGTIKANRDYWSTEDVLVAHADNLVFCDWQDFFTAFDQRPSDCVGTMMLFESDNPQSCGIVELDEQSKVIAFHEKVANPPSNLANGAIYLFDSSLARCVDALPSHASDISIDFMPTVLGKINAWQNDEYLRDIGNPESLAIANEYVKQRNTEVSSC